MSQRSTIVTVVALATVVAGCSSDAKGRTAPAAGPVTVVVSADPGSLDPQKTVTSSAGQLVAFAYDSLVQVDKDSKVVSGLATKWEEKGNTLTFTLGDKATCADGSKVTAKLVADNLSFVTNPKNGSPLNGLYMPSGATVRADEAANTVTVTTKAPFPFALNGIAQVPIVCRGGLTDRKKLAGKTDGTGPYMLTEAVVDDHYTYKLREDYAWGPGGSGVDQAMPKQVVFKVVPNESTAANLLLSGAVNVATVYGPDRSRLKAQNVAHVDLENVAGEFFFNEQAGRPTADPAVRRALIAAVDLDALGKVVTDGNATPSKGMVTLEPRACSGDTVSGNLPESGLDKARAALVEGGWQESGAGWTKNGRPLELTFLYGTDKPLVNAAELTVAQWKKLGVKVTPLSKDSTALNDILFSTGGWDVTSNSLQVQFPSQLLPFLSGPVPSGKGTNFAHLDNPEYERLAAEASRQPGTAGCEQWIAAEAALVKRLDVVPYANLTVPVWTKGVTFRQTAYGIDPSSLRHAG